jgi:hypothetical protein
MGIEPQLPSSALPVTDIRNRSHGGSIRPRLAGACLGSQVKKT